MDTKKVIIQRQITNDGSLYFLDTTVTSNFSSDTTEQINKTLKLISDFDKTSNKFHQDTFSVYDKTTEGCEIIVVNDEASEFVEFYGTLFGEMGKSGFRFYILNGRRPKLFFAVFTNTSYDRPMYQKEIHIKEIEITYQIYSDNKLIAVLDEQKKKQNLSSEGLQEIENNTRQFFKDYIGQIR